MIEGWDEIEKEEKKRRRRRKQQEDGLDNRLIRIR